VLDLGCGIGNFVQILPGKYFGIDFSLEALKEHKEKHKRSVILGDISEIPFKSETFSLCIAVESSQYVADHRKFIIEISRVMKKDGICIIISPNPDSLFWKARQKLKGKSPLNFISIDELISLGKTFGLEIIEIKGIFPVPPSNCKFMLYMTHFNGILNSIFSPFFLRKFIVKKIAKSFILVFKKL